MPCTHRHARFFVTPIDFFWDLPVKSRKTSRIRTADLRKKTSLSYRDGCFSAASFSSGGGVGSQSRLVQRIHAERGKGCAGLRGGDTQRKTEDKSDRYALWQFMYSVQFSLFILISEPWKVRWKVPANIPSQQRQGNVRCKQGRRPGPSSPRALGAPILARG